MGLVDYGSSDESDQESEAHPRNPTARSKPAPGKPAFQKLVDSSNPNKIRVNLEPTEGKKSREEIEEERPVKKAKVGSGGLSDFNALLPAPKRLATNSGTGLGGLPRVNLKTSATPGFTREPMQENNVLRDDEESKLPTPDTLNSIEGIANIVSGGESSELPTEPPRKKSTMFKPLSVTRKPQKKKPPSAAQPLVDAISNPPTLRSSLPMEQPARVSLFSTSMPSDERTITENMSSKTTYEPLLYRPEKSNSIPSAPSTTSDRESIAIIHPDTSPNPDVPDEDQSLDSIAQSLNLTPSQKRQLLGRNASKSSSQAIKVTNFNIDAEYAANEALRQAGETVQHKPVRAIAGGGKHSLKQLVSSAVGQKDALEESFAEGRRNRKEGAGRYGW